MDEMSYLDDVAGRALSHKVEESGFDFQTDHELSFKGQSLRAFGTSPQYVFLYHPLVFSAQYTYPSSRTNK